MKALKIFSWAIVLTGFIYPLFIGVIGNLFFPYQAQGSLIKNKDQIIGSKLIGQAFEQKKFFWPRPSASHYNTLPAKASQLGPTSKKLKEVVEKRKEAFNTSTSIPSDLLFASGSGLDPHISKDSALFQLERVATERSIDPKMIEKIINEKSINIRFKRPFINVLELNLELSHVESN